MFGHSYTGHSEWCDDNNGYELVEDFEINENIDDFYDLEDGIEEMVTTEELLRREECMVMTFLIKHVPKKR